MTRILIKIPTRSRPEKFLAVLERYVDFLSGEHDVRFVISLDDDDDTMNTPEIRARLDEIAERVPLIYRYGTSKTKIEAINADLGDQEADILVVGSDDMVPQVRGFDAIIARDMEKHFPQLDGALNYHDGYKSEHLQKLMTLPVLGWAFYRRCGYVYHPDYDSVYCDREQTDVLRLLGRIVDLPQCIIKHEWPDEVQQDALAKRNESRATYARDRAIYRYRRRRRFGLDTRSARLYRLLTLRWRMKSFRQPAP